MNLFKKLFGKDEKPDEQFEEENAVHISRDPKRQSYGKKGLSVEDLEWTICPIGYPENEGLSYHSPVPNTKAVPERNITPIFKDSEFDRPRTVAQINVEDKKSNTKKENVEKDTAGKREVPVLNVGDKSKNAVEDSNSFPKRVVAPVYQNAKLIIFLIENSEEVAKIKDKLEVIVKSMSATGFIYVINYGNSVRETTITEASAFSSKQLLCEEHIGNKMCLYDALVALKEVVKKYYNQTEWLKYRRARINAIDIIGIGRCIDNCSIVPFEVAIETFKEATVSTDVITKYFCLTEENFINAATIGFHSIGAIAKNNT